MSATLALYARKPLPGAAAFRRISFEVRSDRKNLKIRRRHLSVNMTPPAGWRMSAEAYDAAHRKAMEWVEREGWDKKSLLTVPVAWGEMDAFRHVNNVVYFRHFESGRIVFIDSITRDHAAASGGSKDMASANILGGRDVGIIVAELSAKYRKPVEYPDTLLMAHRVKEDSVTRRKYELEGAIWSYNQGAVTTTSKADMRWFDYTNKKPAECDELMMRLLRQRVGPSGKDSSKL